VIAAVAVVSAGLAVGPSFAGESLLYGEEARNGAVRIVMSSPGRAPLLLHRIPPPAAKRTRRGFMHIPAAFGASSSHFAALVHTSTVTQSGSDFVTEEFLPAIVGGALSGPREVLSGSIPERADAPCRQTHGSPDAVAVDGERIAIAERVVTCVRGEPRPVRVSVSGREPVPLGTDVIVDHVELAGRYLAWLTGDDELVVHDLEAGTAVLRFTPRDLGARFFDDMALRDDGTVALVFGRGRLGILRPGTPGLRVLDRRVSSRGLEIAGERVLYGRMLDSDPYITELVVRPVEGGARQRLARFGPRRPRVGELDLDAQRAAWASQRVGGPNREPRGPARIVVRDL
jgi:hypothetical protein